MNNENIQERINELFSELYGDEIIDYDDRKIGSVEQIRNIMVKNILF